MAQTEHYNFPLVSRKESVTKTFKEWWNDVSGTDSSSMFNVVDAIIYDIDQRTGILSSAGQPDGIALLDSNGLIPASCLPSSVKERRVVATIADRDTITDPFEGLSVFVKDASSDSTVISGGADYIYDGTAWIKTGESESMDMVVDWSEIQNKPDSFVPASHTHPLGEITGTQALYDYMDTLVSDSSDSIHDDIDAAVKDAKDYTDAAIGAVILGGF